MRTSFLLVLASVLLVGACKGPQGDIGPQGATGPGGAVGPTGPAATRPKGDIVGFVTLFDEFGTRLTDNASLTVTVEGSASAVSGVTNADGKYTLNSVESGTYNLIFRRAGLGEFKRLSIQHLGGSVPTSLGNNNLWETAKTVVSSLSATVSSNAITLAGKSSPIQPAGSGTSLQRRARVFFGRDDKLTYLNYVSTFNQFLIPAPTTGSDGSFSLGLTPANITGFKSGDRVYVIGYGISPIENAYTDPQTNLVIYSGVNPTASNVVSFIMP